MKKGIRSLVTTAILAAACCTPAFAATKITIVSNDWNATNGCTVRTVTGYGGYYFNVTVWGVKCPNDPEVFTERHDYWNDYGPTWCEMKTYSVGYSVTGNCGNYSIWRN